MLRFYITIILNIFRIPFYILKMKRYIRHRDKYGEEACYRLARKIARAVQKTSRIKTNFYGKENLPSEGGYIIYPNHQGRYDMLGIVLGHDTPCTFIMDEKRSHMPVTSQICDLLDAKRMVRGDLKQSLSIIIQVADEVKNGRRYVIFPEGTYEHEHTNNQMGEFKSGCFKSAMKVRAPIIPVTLIDSYKPYEGNSYRKVTTETHFLEPIFYEEYQGMSTKEVSDLVKSRIQAKINEVLSARAEDSLQ